jgi:PAS domain S-box-containing protein
MQFREKVYDLIFERDDSNTTQAGAIGIQKEKITTGFPDDGEGSAKSPRISTEVPSRQSANKVSVDRSHFNVILASISKKVKKIPHNVLSFTSQAGHEGSGNWDTLVRSAEAVKFPVFAIDNNRCVIVWNKAMEALTGVAATEILGKGNYVYAVPFYGTKRPMLIDHVVIPPEIEKFLDMGAVTRSGETYNGALEEVWIQGRSMWMQGRATRIYDAEGRVTAAVQSIGITSSENFTSPAMNASDTAGTAQLTTKNNGSGAKVADTPAVDAGELVAGQSEPGINPAALPIETQRHEEELQTAFSQITAREEKLLRNYEELTRITEQLIESERKVRAQELLQCVISDAREGIVAFDRELRYTLWNGFMEDLTGISPKRVLGKRASEMFPLFNVIGADHLIERALTGETAESPDVSFFAPLSSKQVWVRVIYSPLYDSNNEISGVIGIIQDTTARKVMEHSLQTTVVQVMESESKYRNVFNAKNNPLLIVNACTKAIIDLNEAAVRLYGWSKDEMLGMSLLDLSAGQKKNEDATETLFSHDQMRSHLKKDGSVFPVDISGDYFVLKGITVMILSVRDLSSPQQIAESFRIANAKLNLMISITRHDVLNKLTAVTAYNDLLQKDRFEARNKEVLQNQEKAILAIRNQIEFTREYDDFGFREPRWQNVCAVASRVFAQFDQTIQFSCSTGNLEIYVDPLVERVFYNLFDNSFRYGGRLSKISITFIQNPPEGTLYLEDDGVGIPPADKERIFSRGFGGNTGMGLFLIREILSITRIDINETGEYRKGARFEFRIPEGVYRFAASSSPSVISRQEEGLNQSNPLQSFQRQVPQRNCYPNAGKRRRFLYQKRMGSLNAFHQVGKQDRESSQ